MWVQPIHPHFPEPLDLLGGGDEYSREGLRDQLPYLNLFAG